MFAVYRLLLFPLNVITAKRHYCYHDITASYLPSPRYYHEIFAVPVIITVVLLLLPLLCHPLMLNGKCTSHPRELFEAV